MEPILITETPVYMLYVYAQKCTLVWPVVQLKRELLVGNNFVWHIEPYQAQIYNKFSNKMRNILQKMSGIENFATNCFAMLKQQKSCQYTTFYEE